MDEILKYLPFIVPILLVEWGLLITALIHVIKHKKYRFGNQVMWIVIVVLLQILGPILYFTIGRGDEE